MASYYLAHIRQLEFFCCYTCSPKTLHVPLATITATEEIQFPLGVEFAAESENSADAADHLDEFELSVSDTFEENFERDAESFPPYLAYINRSPPPISDPLLKYKYALPISVHVHHSSFGSEIIFQPGRQITAPELNSTVEFEKHACYESADAGMHPKTTTAGSSASWHDSAVLRTIRHGALVSEKLAVVKPKVGASHSSDC